MHAEVETFPQRSVLPSSFRLSHICLCTSSALSALTRMHARAGGDWAEGWNLPRLRTVMALHYGFTSPTQCIKYLLGSHDQVRLRAAVCGAPMCQYACKAELDFRVATGVLPCASMHAMQSWISALHTGVLLCASMHAMQSWVLALLFVVLPCTSMHAKAKHGLFNDSCAVGLRPRSGAGRAGHGTRTTR